MQSAASTSNKQLQTKWNEYERLDQEPKIDRHYGLSHELEDELLARRFFLKRRVWRNMGKIRRRQAMPPEHHNFHRLKPARTH